MSPEITLYGCHPPLNLLPNPARTMAKGKRKATRIRRGGGVRSFSSIAKCDWTEAAMNVQRVNCKSGRINPGPPMVCSSINFTFMLVKDGQEATEE